MTDKLNAMRAAGLIGEKSRILYVDDGSKDRTWELVSHFNWETPGVGGKAGPQPGPPKARPALRPDERHAPV